MDQDSPILLLFIFLFGFGSAFLLFSLYLRKKIGSLEQYRMEKERLAQTKAEEIIKEGEKQAELLHQRRASDLEKKALEARSKIEKEENRLREREDKLDGRFTSLEKRWSELEKKELWLEKRGKKSECDQAELLQKEAALNLQLEKLSSLSMEEAKTALFAKVNRENEESWNEIFRRKKAALEENAEQEAARLIATACQKVAGKSSQSYSTIEIELSNPEVRGRIIGREGRNIQFFERMTGTTLVIEDRLNRLLISCFDPYRREVAKQALHHLIQDGRIHPTSIEEAVSQARPLVQKMMHDRADEACSSLGIKGLHPGLKDLLGACSLRNSLGQNILEHLVEVAQFMGQMAAELSCDIELAKRIGLLHDIGKAAPKEMEGPHDLVGAELAKKYGESPKVVNGIESHHGRLPASSTEAILCRSADTLSASRTGARSESSEKCRERSELMEKIAFTFPGIERAYALSAGRELHLFVDAKKVDDKEASHLASKIRNELQKNPDLPGQIKLVILREKKTVEFAL